MQYLRSSLLYFLFLHVGVVLGVELLQRLVDGVVEGAGVVLREAERRFYLEHVVEGAVGRDLIQKQ